MCVCGGVCVRVVVGGMAVAKMVGKKKKKKNGGGWWGGGGGRRWKRGGGECAVEVDSQASDFDVSLLGFDDAEIEPTGSEDVKTMTSMLKVNSPNAVIKSGDLWL